jgi:hypothetical protein
MRRIDQVVEGATTLLFLVIGIGMVAIAAWSDLQSSVAITFAVLGTGLIALGGLGRLIEGNLELGPQGIKTQIRERQAVVRTVLEQANPELASDLDHLFDYVTAAQSGQSPPYIKGPSLIIPGDPGQEVRLDIDKLERLASREERRGDDDSNEPLMPAGR